MFLVGVRFLQKQQAPCFPGTQIFKTVILAGYELFLITPSDRILSFEGITRGVKGNKDI